MSKVLIVGAGAAGLLAGIAAAERGAEVTILEKMYTPGRKLLITGKGRCNLTNNCDLTEFFNNFPGNGKFLNSALRQFTNEDMVKLLEEHGLPTKVERGGRVFPASDLAKDVVDKLVSIFHAYGGKLITDTYVTKLIIVEHVI
ncbi:MAG: NAD(P)/FAD-dependent oxidoreductase, partial [Acidaminococcaceae bacterium]